MEVSRSWGWGSRIKKYYQLSCSGLTRTSKRWFELQFDDMQGNAPAEPEAQAVPACGGWLFRMV